MSDRSLQERIEELVEEEHRLMGEATGGGPDPERHKRLGELKVELDTCWDLLRQRRGLEEFGLDPDEASARDEDTVENYEQ
ncbi:MAG: hypothetical protein QOI98_2000 [Solirubrobacteraceae bacterium]|jgi:hypothetical protein|nr:hypothetical protein [Solirubrobacteraceae bacterium]